MGAPSVNTAFFEPTTPDEVYSAFISLKNSKARDIDGLQIKPIKFAIDFLVHAFTHVFNICLSTGVFPAKMQQAKVTALFKSGDRNDMTCQIIGRCQCSPSFQKVWRRSFVKGLCRFVKSINYYLRINSGFVRDDRLN